MKKSVTAAKETGIRSGHGKAYGAYRLAAAALTALTISAGSAETDENDYSTWYRLAVNEATIHTAACWVDPADETQTKVVAAEGGKYYVPEGIAARTPDVNSTFPGDVLAVAGTVRLVNYAKTHTFNELRLLPGSLCRHHGTYNYLAGNVVIEGTDADPSVVELFFYGMKNHFEHKSAFHGSGSSYVRFRSTTLSVTREQMIACYAGIFGSWDNYFGKVTFGTNVCARLDANADTFPGEVHIEKNGMLYVPYLSAILDTGVTVGTLTLDDGAMIYSEYRSGKPCGITVTNRLNVTGSPIFIRECDIPTDNILPVLKLSGAAAENPPDVSNMKLELNTFTGDLADKARCVLRENEDGTKDLCFVWDDILHLVKQSGSYKAEESSFYETNQTHWSSGVIPDSSFTGTVYCADRRLMWRKWVHFSYPGMTVYTRGTVNVHAHSLDLKMLNLLGSSYLATFSGPDITTLKAPVKIWGGDIKVAGRQKHHFILTGEISGTGSITVRRDAETQYYTAEFRGTNVNYHGSVRIYSAPGSYSPDESLDGSTHFVIGDARNIGGVYEGDDGWKAFSVVNYSLVKFNGDITLDEPTRGLFVSGGANFEVPSQKTLTVNYPMTYSGELVKLGTGTLVLGCQAPGFATNGVPYETPLEGTNVLTIAEGRLKISSSEAVNGLAVNFAAGTGLVLNPYPADEDLATFGVKNTEWSAPFTSEAENGAIPVSFESATLPDAPFTAAICTVSSEAAASLSFDVPDAVQKRACTLSRRTNADGTVTFLAQIAGKPALVISIR